MSAIDPQGKPGDIIMKDDGHWDITWKEIVAAPFVFVALGFACAAACLCLLAGILLAVKLLELITGIGLLT